MNARRHSRATNDVRFASTTREALVGMGEMVVTSEPDTVLVAHGLGSCVGVAAYDPVARVGGLLHVMLPERSTRGEDSNPCRYADTGIAAMLAELRARGAYPKRLVIKAGGGASTVSLPGSDPGLRVGKRNADAVRAALGLHGLSLAADDFGGGTGRTMRLWLSDGAVTVQEVGRKPRAL